MATKVFKCETVCGHKLGECPRPARPARSARSRSAEQVRDEAEQMNAILDRARVVGADYAFVFGGEMVDAGTATLLFIEEFGWVGSDPVRVWAHITDMLRETGFRAREYRGRGYVRNPGHGSNVPLALQ